METTLQPKLFDNDTNTQSIVEPPATNWKVEMRKEHQHAELLRLKAGQEGCGCSDCQKFYQILDLSQFGDRVKHYGSTVMVLSGSTGADKKHTDISEGWHRTERFGEVFVAPSGRAWSVKEIGGRLENVIVEISATDILGNDRAFKKKDALRKQAERARTKGSRTKQPLHKLTQSFYLSRGH